ncbi:MAG TPA: putative lipid II flippase FtsW [Geobacterales bacterium]|nr:putative lipid II flippase FtsW [Geobacterales bacterium]
MKRFADTDQMLLLLVAILCCLGLVMVYSASSVMAAKRFHDGLHFISRQGIFLLIGLLAMTLAMRLDYHIWERLAVPILIASLILLVAVLIPGIGSRIGGSSRWIRLPGFSLQPSEPAKIAFIMYLAWSLAKKQDKVRLFSTGFLPYMVVLAFMLVLLLAQPDLGAAMTLAVVAMVILFVAGTRPVYIVSMVLLALPLLYYAVMHVDYRRRRILAFLNPWEDPTNTGFQIIQSWIALGNGGLFGEGLGEGKQKLFYLPEAHTDFILSVIGEELGFIGVAAVAILFLLVVLRGVRIAVHAPDTFGRFLAFGLSVLMGLGAFINMGVVLGLLPTKGLALPFISYGGSSLVMSLFAVGILLNIASQSRRTS